MSREDVNGAWLTLGVIGAVAMAGTVSKGHGSRAKAAPVIPNRYPGPCARCKVMVEAGKGKAVKGKTGGWAVYHEACLKGADLPSPEEDLNLLPPGTRVKISRSDGSFRPEVFKVERAELEGGWNPETKTREVAVRYVVRIDGLDKRFGPAEVIEVFNAPEPMSEQALLRAECFRIKSKLGPSIPAIHAAERVLDRLARGDYPQRGADPSRPYESIKGHLKTFVKLGLVEMVDGRAVMTDLYHRCFGREGGQT